MDWENERYVRLYVRETIDDLALSWEAIAVWRALLTKLDRAGLIELNGKPLKLVAAMIRMPWSVVDGALDELRSDGRIEINSEYLVAPNFIEAQEAKQSDRQRQADSRARRRDKARLDKLRGDVTNRDTSQNVTSPPGSVTGVRGVVTKTPENVTPSLAEPSRAEPTQNDRGEDSPRREIPSEALDLADRLGEHIRSRQADVKGVQNGTWQKTRERWADSFRLAQSRDNRSWDEMATVLDWCQTDTFWQGNILSADKFRKQFDQLKAQMARKIRNNDPSHGYSPPSDEHDPGEDIPF
jgi:hypothetical protein